MGGEIGVESEPDAGSNFWFKIWLENRPSRQSSESTALHHLRVLVADGQATSREAMAELLACWRMKVDCADSGVVSLAMLRAAVSEEEPYRLVIVDRSLPDIDALRFAGMIRDDPGLPATPVLMMRSMLQRLNEGPAGGAGVAGCLTKPVRQSQLYDSLATALDLAPENANSPKPAPKHRLPFEARILVAEDNIVNQRLLVLMLEKAGCRVDVAANGLEAVNALKLLPYDLVLMDCQMPEMDGFAATRAIRDYEAAVASGRVTPACNSSFALAHSRSAHIAIVALTANAMAGDRESCLDAGMDGYVAKPVRAEALLDLIEKTLATIRSSPAQAPSPAL